MNDRFRKALMLALRPDTGENEAAAAFSALRRMASNGNVSGLLNQETETKVVYKEKIVYIPKAYTHQLTYVINVPASYLQSYINVIFKEASKFDIYVKIIYLNGSDDNRITSPSKIKFQAFGYKLHMDYYRNFLDNIEKEMLAKESSKILTKKPGIFKQIFKAIFD